MEWTKNLNKNEVQGIAKQPPSTFASLVSKGVMIGLIAQYNAQLKQQGSAPLGSYESRTMKQTPVMKKLELEVGKLVDRMDKATGGGGESAVLYVEKEFKELAKKIAQGRL